MFSCFLLVPALVPALVFKQWIWNCAWRSWKHGFLLFGVYAGVIMMSSFVDRVFQHCLGSTRGKEVHSNSQGLKSRQTIIFCFHFYHLPRQTVSPAANSSTTARRMLNTSQYQPSCVQPFVSTICWVFHSTLCRLILLPRPWLLWRVLGRLFSYKPAANSEFMISLANGKKGFGATTAHQ